MLLSMQASRCCIEYFILASFDRYSLSSSNKAIDTRSTKCS
jgi:hypothetical protein